MPDLDYLRIIKWILIVLLAGFIGQFGKSLAKHLIEKARLKRKGSPPETGETVPSADGGHTERADIHEPHPPAISPEEQAGHDKKLAKTLTKQKKKEAKALKKQADL